MASLSRLPVALAAVFISLGSVAPGQMEAADHSKGAECAAIDDPMARLACFDAAFPRASHASVPKPAATAPAAAPAAATVPAPPAAAAGATDGAASETQEFGLSSKQRTPLDAKPVESRVIATTAAVATVRRLPSGYLLVGLDNGQVWQQTELDSQVWLEPGDQVTIRRASLGSYLLVTPRKYSTRMRRVR